MTESQDCTQVMLPSIEPAKNKIAEVKSSPVIESQVTDKLPSKITVNEAPKSQSKTHVSDTVTERRYPLLIRIPSICLEL